jgi:hypothetical protein
MEEPQPWKERGLGLFLAASITKDALVLERLGDLGPRNLD